MRSYRIGPTALAVFILWSIYGLFSASLSHYRSSFSATPMTWASALLLEGAYAYIAALLTPAVLLAGRRLRLDRNSFPNAALHLMFGFLFASTAKILWDVVAYGPSGYLFHEFTLTKLFRSVNYGLDMGVLLYWLVILLDYAVDYYWRYEAGLVEASHLQAQLAQAQLQALKMQIHPHFLFNTLHTISALIQEDPVAAERTIARLSDLLRLSLESTAVHEVTLDQELRFLDLYLDIERTRFEERLVVDFAIEEAARDALVPNLILQPLVENSIRHGVSKQRGMGIIRVAARRQNGALILRVTDNGPGLVVARPGKTRTGVGLSTTRGRLETLYGANQSFELLDLASGGAEATIRLPWRLDPAVKGESWTEPALPEPALPSETTGTSPKAWMRELPLPD